MLILMVWLFFFMYFIGLLIFCIKCNHLLLMLLSFEFVILSLYLGLFILMSLYCFEYYFVMVFFTLSVCESVLGLSILILMIRSYGNDYFQSFSVLW